MYSNDLVVALKEIRTDWNAVLAKLDTDTGVTATNYVSTCAIPAVQAIDYSPGGVCSDDDTFKRISDAVTSINAVNAKLDADSLAASDYVSKYNVTNLIKAGCGMPQNLIVKMLYNIKTAINAIEAYLDADGTVNTTTYASGNPVTFDVDATRC